MFFYAQNLALLHECDLAFQVFHIVGSNEMPLCKYFSTTKKISIFLYYTKVSILTGAKKLISATKTTCIFNPRVYALKRKFWLIEHA